jgi:tetratricopeptide (TPR) repeat protein
MTSVARDALGLPVTVASPEALAAYDTAVRGLLSWDGATTVMFEAAVAADPGLALAHVGAAVCYFLEERFAEAAAAGARAHAVPGLTERERGHVDALALFVRGAAADAERRMRAHIAAYPGDLLIVQRLYYLYFWQGRFPEMLELTEALVAAGDAHGFLRGLHAFALGEGGRFTEAVRTAEGALADNARDAWAVHALAHALYDMGAAAEGIARVPSAIHPCRHLGWFRNHLLWHLALLHWSRGNYERAAALSRTVFERAPSAVPGELHDSISLLWRFELAGRSPGDRWRPFTAIARGRLERHGLLFHAVHMAMALAAGGEWAVAERHLDVMRAKAARDATGLTGEVAIPLIEGMHAFAGGDYARVIARVEPLTSRIIELGGSRAQRDVFHDTLLEACFRAGDGERATALLTARVARRPDHWWTTRVAAASRG